MPTTDIEDEIISGINYTMRNQDGIISEWFEIDDAIEYQFMKQGAYKILAKFSNKARMYEVETNPPLEVAPGCVPSELLYNEIGQENNQKPDPTYKSR